MNGHGDRAKSLFLEGYNCAQAVFCAFAAELGLDFETAAKIASGFGGGIGRMRETCGAFSGMVMAVSLAKGHSLPKNQAEKQAHYALIQQLASQFREANGSIICRELLGTEGKDSTPQPQARTESYYQKRPCPELVKTAALLLEQVLLDESAS